MAENILNPEGLYNPSLRFAFTNITEEPFESKWNGSPITVPAGSTIELEHHLAVKLTKELVDKIMIGNAKLDELAKNQPYYRSPMGPSLGIPMARKVWEDKICRLLETNEESPQIQVLRAQIKAQLLDDLSKESSGGNPLENAPSSINEFAGIDNSSVKEEKSPMKIKTLKK